MFCILWKWSDTWQRTQTLQNSTGFSVCAQFSSVRNKCACVRTVSAHHPSHMCTFHHNRKLCEKTSCATIPNFPRREKKAFNLINDMRTVQTFDVENIKVSTLFRNSLKPLDQSNNGRLFIENYGQSIAICMYIRFFISYGEIIGWLQIHTSYKW